MTDHDPDAGLTPAERTRRALHRAVDRICDSWPKAVDDANARGYPTGRDWNDTTSGGSSMIVDDERIPATSVEIVALNPSKAVAWLAELADIVDQTAGRKAVDRPDHVRYYLHWTVENGKPSEHWTIRVIRLANRACLNWPDPPKPGTSVDGVTVGERGNQVEICAHCKEPVPVGRLLNGRPMIIRVDGKPYHRNTCYMRMRRKRALTVADGKSAGQGTT